MFTSILPSLRFRFSSHCHLIHPHFYIECPFYFYISSSIMTYIALQTSTHYVPQTLLWFFRFAAHKTLHAPYFIYYLHCVRAIPLTDLGLLHFSVVPNIPFNALIYPPTLIFYLEIRTQKYTQNMLTGKDSDNVATDINPAKLCRFLGPLL